MGQPLELYSICMAEFPQIEVRSQPHSGSVTAIVSLA